MKMPVLKLKLLGQMECRLPSGESLKLSTRKSEVLLAYLALPPGIRHPRDRLINLLWSDRGEDQADASAAATAPESLISPNVPRSGPWNEVSRYSSLSCAGRPLPGTFSCRVYRRHREWLHSCNDRRCRCKSDIHHRWTELSAIAGLCRGCRRICPRTHAFLEIAVLAVIRCFRVGRDAVCPAAHRATHPSTACKVL